MRTFKTKDEAKKYYEQVVKPIAKALNISPWCFVRIAGSSCEFKDPTFEEARISDYMISVDIANSCVMWRDPNVPKPTWLHGRKKDTNRNRRIEPLTENDRIFINLINTVRPEQYKEINKLKAEEAKLKEEIELLKADNKALVDKVEYLEINLRSLLQDKPSQFMELIEIHGLL